MRPFSAHIVYLDESGSPEPSADRADYPIFVLAAILAAKQVYLHQIVPAFQDLKFRHFGHDQIIFHERDIRRQSGAFTVLRGDPALRRRFLDDVGQFVTDAGFEVLAAMIDKRRIGQRADLLAIYEVSLALIMQAVADILLERGEAGNTVHLVAESRGHAEDEALLLAFRRIAVGLSIVDDLPPLTPGLLDWQLIFSDKRSNSAGLQIADLLARPLGLAHLHPQRPNRAANTILRKSGTRTLVFPDS